MTQWEQWVALTAANATCLSRARTQHTYCLDGIYYMYIFRWFPNVEYDITCALCELPQHNKSQVYLFITCFHFPFAILWQILCSCFCVLFWFVARLECPALPADGRLGARWHLLLSVRHPFRRPSTEADANWRQSKSKPKIQIRKWLENLGFCATRATTKIIAAKRTQ